MTRLRICLIASSRFPVVEPFAGGLEAHTHALTRALAERGHSVSLFAADGSDPELDIDRIDAGRFEASETARQDVGASPEQWMQEHHAYLGLMLELALNGGDRFDVVHNNSLHHLPVAMAATLPVPMITTLHTPPTPWLESAMRLSARDSAFVAVSAHTAGLWRQSVDARVVRNGVDTDRWVAGPGGSGAVWTGRLVPEKGPHLAIDAARRAGIGLRLAGPRMDPAYFEAEVAPRLGGDISYVGHLSSADLVELVGSAAVAVVTPCWDEPYGLVAAEALACGTPVASFARGGLTEVIDASCGRLAPAGDIPALAEAIRQAAGLSRDAARAHAVRHCSLDAMVDSYERLYVSATERLAA